MNNADQRIVPSLWFKGDAKEAVDFYSSVFSGVKILSTTYYPEEGIAEFQKDLIGQLLTIEFELQGFHFTAINAGDEFTPNPSISFFLNFDPSRDEYAREHLDTVWKKLLDGGEALIPIGEHPFSKRYGWVRDKYNITWQLILTNPDGDPRPFIVPSLMFAKENTNHAEEAIDFYISVFNDASKQVAAPYQEVTGPANAGALAYGDFTLLNQWFAAMDTGVEQDFTFNEGISLVVRCKDQSEIDYYWNRLSTVPESEQCGWCKDKYGVSWQIVPEDIDELIAKPGGFATLMSQTKIVISDY